MNNKKLFGDNELDIEEDDSFDGGLESDFEESLDELEEEEIINSFPKLDTFSEVKKHDGTYSYDEQYFDGE